MDSPLRVRRQYATILGLTQAVVVAADIWGLIESFSSKGRQSDWRVTSLPDLKNGYMLDVRISIPALAVDQVSAKIIGTQVVLVGWYKDNGTVVPGLSNLPLDDASFDAVFAAFIGEALLYLRRIDRAQVSRWSSSARAILAPLV